MKCLTIIAIFLFSLSGLAAEKMLPKSLPTNYPTMNFDSLVEDAPRKQDKAPEFISDAEFSKEKQTPSTADIEYRRQLTLQILRADEAERVRSAERERQREIFAEQERLELIRQQNSHRPVSCTSYKIGNIVQTDCH